MSSNIVAFAGDWHLSGNWARHRIAEVGARGVRTLFHVGDFEIRAGLPGERFRAVVDEACREHDVTIYVTPGNREDWPMILGASVDERDDFGPLAWFGDRIAVLPRGHRFTHGGRSFVSLGGAPSINFETCVRGVDWFPEEMITRDDVAAVVAGGPAEVMIAHDAPDAPWQTGQVEGICTHNPGGWSAMALAYAAIGRRRITEAFLAVAPELFVHGHYHVDDSRIVELPSGDECRMVSLDCDGTDGSLAFVDLDTLGPAAGS
ncbi:metallophosphoesterase [Rhodococcus qingshengii]|uniref:metallophosphoesterase n=1 Tax=Rhodococcus qingshengii TaxID=334542 RepID=UPI00287F9E28|nr:metallophosphoesterase [Rhodococcus qingshengii]